MANIFLAISQYKKLPVAEIKRIKTSLHMDGWEPTFKDQGFHPAFDESVGMLFGSNGHRIRYSIVNGDGNLPRSRAMNLATWRKEYDTDLRCDYFMVVDDDISFTPDSIDTLIGDDRPIIGGIYTFKTNKKNYVGKACTRFLPGQSLHDRGPLEVQWLNGGFILIRGDALLHMISRYPHLVFDVSKDSGVPAEVSWALWLPMIHDRIFLGEDWAFCQRARDIGYKIYADLRVHLVHWDGDNGFTISL